MNLRSFCASSSALFSLRLILSRKREFPRTRTVSVEGLIPAFLQ